MADIGDMVSIDGHQFIRTEWSWVKLELIDEFEVIQAIDNTWFVHGIREDTDTVWSFFKGCESRQVAEELLDALLSDLHR